jgi:hypothetical protein
MLRDELIKDQAKKVRCASCGHTWMEKAAPETLQESFAAVMTERTVIEQKDHRFKILFGTFVALTLCTLMVLNRYEVVKYVPAAQRIYQFLNLSTLHPGEGLKFSDVHCVTEIHNGQKYMYVTGTIANTTKNVLQIPQLEFYVLGDEQASGGGIGQKKINGKVVLHSWKMNLTENKLLAEEKTQFESDKILMSADAKSVVIRL